MYDRKWFYLAGLLLILTACQPITTVVEPTSQWIRVDVSPSTTWILPALDSCAQAAGAVDLSVREVSRRALDLEAADLLILSGSWTSEEGTAFEIGKIRLSAVVHPENPVGELSAKALADLFSGRVRQWVQVEPSLPAEDIQVWLPVPGDEIWDGVVHGILAGDQPSPLARMAPDPQAMRAAVSSDEFSVGILTSSYLDSTVKAVDSSLEVWLSVLAVSRTQPAGAVRELLVCLQEEITK